MHLFTRQLDRDGLQDLNIQADWQRKGGTYWVRYVHVEIQGFINTSKPFVSNSIIFAIIREKTFISNSLLLKYNGLAPTYADYEFQCPQT